jgi:signal recognition particle receptor subunit beta
MTAVNARIALWGIAGAGKSTTLRTIYKKLRSDLRGELRREPTRLDPTVYYETLPILLGQVGDFENQIEIVAVPGADDMAMTRKQLLDQVDGIVLVLDCAPERIEANWDSIEELRASLEDYGRRLDKFPLVLQYNKRDIADPFAIEELHRRIGLTRAAVFETIATTGHGILPALTTIAKNVVRARKGKTEAHSAQSDSTIETVGAETDHALSAPHEILEAAILAEGEDGENSESVETVQLELSASGVQPDWSAVAEHDSKPESGLGGRLRVVSVGEATLERDAGIRLPLVLGDESGQTHSVVLSLRLDSVVDTGND